MGKTALAQGPQSVAMAAPRLCPAHRTLRRARAASQCCPAELLESPLWLTPIDQHLFSLQSFIYSAPLTLALPR